MGACKRQDVVKAQALLGRSSCLLNVGFKALGAVGVKTLAQARRAFETERHAFRCVSLRFARR